MLRRQASYKKPSYYFIDVAVLCTTTCLHASLFSPLPLSIYTLQQLEPTHNSQANQEEEERRRRTSRSIVTSVMAKSPCKCLLLLALLLSFFFFTATATARSFGVMESDRHLYESGEKGRQDSKFKPSEDRVPPEEEEAGDLAEMDYTPPRKKPPIHN